MKFSIVSSDRHHGKQLAIDPDHETVDILDAAGRLLGRVSWESIIESALTTGEDSRFVRCRDYVRAPLSVKVRYTTSEGRQFDGLTGGIGGGGLFIESSDPLARGTELTVQFALPDRPWEEVRAKAKVVWARTKPERYLLFPGMGIQFTEIDEQARAQLVDLVDALNRNRAPSPP